VHVSTANLDFGKGEVAHRRYLEYLTEHCDVLCVQEAKRITLADLLPEGWKTNQVTDTAAHRGSAVCFKDDVPHGEHKLVLGATPRGARMLARSFSVQRMAVAGIAGSKVISVHYPPKRYAFLWPAYTRALAAEIRTAEHHGHQVLVGGDFNQRPWRVARKLNKLGCHLTSHGDGKIDGFLITPGLKVTQFHIDRYGLRNKLTDHPSPRADVAARPKRKAAA